MLANIVDTICSTFLSLLTRADASCNKGLVGFVGVVGVIKTDTSRGRHQVTIVNYKADDGRLDGRPFCTNARVLAGHTQVWW